MSEAMIEFVACGKTELEYGCQLSVVGDRLVVRIPEEPQYSWEISLDPIKKLMGAPQSHAEEQAGEIRSPS